MLVGDSKPNCKIVKDGECIEKLNIIADVMNAHYIGIGRVRANRDTN